MSVSERKPSLPPSVMHIGNRFIPVEVLSDSRKHHDGQQIVKYVGEDHELLFEVALPQGYTLSLNAPFGDIYVSLDYLKRMQRGRRRLR